MDNTRDVSRISRWIVAVSMVANYWIAENEQLLPIGNKATQTELTPNASRGILSNL